jgi:uncharacterized membrane protein YdjX (TVP38/TMEM64 family)
MESTPLPAACQETGTSGIDQMSEAQGRSSGLRRWLPVLLLAAAIGTFFALGLGRYLTWEVFRDNRQWLLDEIARMGVVAPLIYILVYTGVAALSVPGGAILTITGGFLFGPWLGGLYSLVGATIGGSIVFLIARTSFGDLLRERAGPALRKLEAGFREDSANYLLFLRLVPLFPFWLVNLVPAFFDVSLRSFVLFSFIGMAPGSFVYSSVGAGAGALIARGETPDLRIIFQWQVLGPLTALAVLALVPVVYKRVKNRQEQTAP